MDNDRLKYLTAARDKLLTELAAAVGKDAAPLVRELRATLAEIEDLAPAREVSRLDELAARREARLADSPRQAGTGS